MDNDKYLAAVLDSQNLPEDSTELEQLRAHRAEVDALLKREFGKAHIRYGGSKAKGTLIRDAYDLDIICYFDQDDADAGKTLKDIFGHVQAVLAKQYVVQPKTSSLRLRGKDTSTLGQDFHIDVVPGRYVDASNGDCFIYQNSGEKERLKTNLDVHIQHVKDSGVLDAIRLLKLWKVRRSLRIKQFAFDLLVIKLLKEKKSASLAAQLRHVWQELWDAAGPLPVEDPANPSGNDLSKVLDAATWSELASAARNTLDSIEWFGWEQVYGPIAKISAEDRTERLRAAAATVVTPTKAWCSNA
jgi:hypothetical protein